ncbi:hypothetical protein GW17_00003589 [Ensete ventricosum]|nr:hypothetical protein GW17_00003589 [Ensete ventricosum]
MKNFFDLSRRNASKKGARTRKQKCPKTLTRSPPPLEVSSGSTAIRPSIKTRKCLHFSWIPRNESVTCASKQSEKREDEKRKNLNQNSEHILGGGNRATPYQKGEYNSRCRSARPLLRRFLQGSLGKPKEGARRNQREKGGGVSSSAATDQRIKREEESAKSDGGGLRVRGVGTGRCEVGDEASWWWRERNGRRERGGLRCEAEPWAPRRFSSASLKFKRLSHPFVHPPNRMLTGGVAVQIILSLRAVSHTYPVPTTGWLQRQSGGPPFSVISCLSAHE